MLINEYWNVNTLIRTWIVWISGAVAQWRSGAVAQWRSGAVAQWRSGAVAQWRSGESYGPSTKRISNTACSLCVVPVNSAVSNDT